MFYSTYSSDHFIVYKIRDSKLFPLNFLKMMLQFSVVSNAVAAEYGINMILFFFFLSLSLSFYDFPFRLDLTTKCPELSFVTIVTVVVVCVS